MDNQCANDILILYTDGHGALVTSRYPVSSAEQKIPIEEIWRHLKMIHSLEPGDFSWFCNTLLLSAQSEIVRGERIVALRPARLPPAQWRAQRVQRASQ